MKIRQSEKTTYSMIPLICHFGKGKIINYGEEISSCQRLLGLGVWVHYKDEAMGIWWGLFCILIIMVVVTQL